MQTITIKLSKKTREKLEKLKISENESYEEIIERIIDSVADESLTDEELKQIKESLKDIKEGRILSLKEAEKEWGI